MDSWNDAVEFARRQKEWEKEREEWYKAQREARGEKECVYKEEPPKYDSIYTMETGSAVVLYVVVMVGGAIFNDRWLIWIVATFVFLKYLFRHDIKKK